MIYIETRQQTDTRLRIIETMEDVTGVPRELWERKRTRNTEEVMLRHIFIDMLHNYGKFTLQTIARIVGLKNHCTILQSLDRTEEWSQDEKFEHEYSLLTEVKDSYEQRIGKSVDSLIG